METDTPETNNLAQWSDNCGWAVDIDFARKLERERNALRDAIRLAVAKHDKIAWGYDGDAGSNAIISELDDSLENENCPSVDANEPKS